MNKQVNVPALTKIMQDFARENEKSELTGEMLGDAMDDAMADDNDEEEQERIVGQVLDELGLKMGESVSTVVHLCLLMCLVELEHVDVVGVIILYCSGGCGAFSDLMPPASDPCFVQVPEAPSGVQAPAQQEATAAQAPVAADPGMSELEARLNNLRRG